MGNKAEGRGHIKEKAVKTLIQKTEPRKAQKTEHPDAYLREIAAEFGCCETTVTYACRKLKITRKKDNAI